MSGNANPLRNSQSFTIHKIVEMTGQSITLTHLAPFVDVSRQKHRKEVREEFLKVGIAASDEKINEVAEMRTLEEIKKGVQTIQYQVITLMTTNGQAPFVTVFMYLNEAKDERTKADLALVIEESLRQRMKGVKNEKGVWVTPAFPKLIYVLQEDNVKPDSKYYYLTKIAAECSAKRLVPDYISEKIMLKEKGSAYPAMGCRSFLSVDRAGEVGNISNAENFDGTPKYYGRLTAWLSRP